MTHPLLNGFGSSRFRPDPKKPPTEKKKPQPIKKQSAKNIRNTREYSEGRKIFLAMPENKWCYVEGCGKRANTVDHIMGREGFADDHARTNNIPLLLDERYWKPCCLEHNLEMETNQELKNKYHLSQIHGGKIK